MKTNLTHLNDTGKYAMGGINQPSLVTNYVEDEIRLTDEKGTKKITAEYLRQIERNSVLIFLRLLVFEGKFTKEETDNIKKMLESNDEASKELAVVILKNEGYEYIF